MSRLRVALLAVIGLLSGGALLLYVMGNLPPYTRSGQLSATALLLFFFALFLSISGGTTLLALWLHKRWPVLGGRRRGRRSQAGENGESALRQGLLIGVTTVTLIALAIVDLFDITFLIVAIVLAGLIEAFAQTRG